ncbi:nucleotidyl transferase AbiEii/AbiGii toxin family protein [Candidatus Woesearchaeota archaeon]|nr:nucleotidyl transferase AbiEii/AbiGii toxin family protein [Candidatus Woesearchaeota archaeon]
MAELELIKMRALRTGISINYISKDEKISNMLEQISRIFEDKIVLKGGTALNRVYLQKFNAARFSEDIDFDFILNKPLADKIKFVKKGVKLIKDFKIDKGRLLHRTLRFDCFYTNEIGHRDKIRIEFYLSHPKQLSVKKSENTLIKSSFIDSASCMFNTYSLEDLIARKLITLYNRNEGKDVYDLFYSLELKYDKKEVEKALAILLKFFHIKLTVKAFLSALLIKIGQLKENSYYIGNSTNHYLPKELRPEWSIFIGTLEQKIERLKQ